MAWLDNYNANGDAALNQFMHGNGVGGYGVDNLSAESMGQVLETVRSMIGQPGVDTSAMMKSYVDPLAANNRITPSLYNSILDTYTTAMNSGAYTGGNIPDGLTALLMKGMGGGGPQTLAAISQTLGTLGSNGKIAGTGEFANLYNTFMGNVGRNLGGVSPSMWGIVANPFLAVKQTNPKLAGSLGFPSDGGSYLPDQQGLLAQVQNNLNAITSGKSVGSVLSNLIQNSIQKALSYGVKPGSGTPATPSVVMKATGAAANVGGSGASKADKRLKIDEEKQILMVYKTKPAILKALNNAQGRLRGAIGDDGLAELYAWASNLK